MTVGVLIFFFFLHYVVFNSFNRVRSNFAIIKTKKTFSSCVWTIGNIVDSFQARLRNWNKSYRKRLTSIVEVTLFPTIQMLREVIFVVKRSLLLFMFSHAE